MFRACWHSLCACLLSLLSGVGASYAQGVITTVAGTDWVFPKTSVPALTASLGQVRGIAVDIGGNVFLTDQDNSMVMRISRYWLATAHGGSPERAGRPLARLCHIRRVLRWMLPARCISRTPPTTASARWR